MKKQLLFTGFVLGAALAFAGGVENKTNMSTGYLRNPSRNAETSRPEAAFYNIAGTAYLQDGLWLELGNQFVFKEYTNSVDDAQLKAVGVDGDYSDTTTVWLYPDFDAVYRHGDFSVFGNFGIYAGGGTLNYDDGTALTGALLASKGKELAAAGGAAAAGAPLLIAAAKDHSVVINSITYGGTLGGAYKFLDGMVSVGAGLRMVYGTQSMELESSSLKALNGGDTISYDAKALGFGGVFGVHARPVDKLDVSLQYSTITKIEYELDNVKGNLAGGLGLEDGDKFNTDLPASFAFGAAYNVIDPLSLSFSFTYYFNKQAELDNALSESDYDDSFELALGADYKINDKVSASLGFAYAKQGTTDEDNSAFSPVLDSFSVGAGVEVYPVKNLTVTLAGMYVNYFDKTYDVGVDLDLSKDLWMASIGATYMLPF